MDNAGPVLELEGLLSAEASVSAAPLIKKVWFFVKTLQTILLKRGTKISKRFGV